MGMYILLFIIFISAVFLERIKHHYTHNKQGWKVQKISYKQIDYSEKINEKWQTIKIDANITIGTFEPFFKSKEAWKSYPNWAQNRSLIIERVTKKFPLKDEIRLIGADDDI
ncbi:hypothetical protein KORDIASMS9_03176 [Kordia sp. SMS9]|uniref:hypothetical protein n=1 Tax=Kordia sp. SMS9 TaxID=2282170 RepID=UPI000E0CF825|nr:hypothetical protein [Kordia sp. SMS9]AXG70921.1 hypothetical protein KORDIASMS9_03176 [Kordia sp. SMS9]